MTEFQGTPSGAGRRVCIIASRFNVMVTERLLEGAIKTLVERGVSAETIDIIRVPGAWELPTAAAAAAHRGYDAIVALGCVIRGETEHFERVSRAAVDGLMRVQQSSGIPIGLGVLTPHDLTQALARAGGDAGHAGAQAADAALEMAAILGHLKGSP